MQTLIRKMAAEITVCKVVEKCQACTQHGILRKQANVIRRTVVLSVFLANVGLPSKAQQQRLGVLALLSCQLIEDDAEDDDDYAHDPVADRCLLEELFAGMPPFDLDMLFEDEVAPE